MSRLMFVVDYVCWKLSKVTSDIIDQPYEDVIRKFKTYRALEELESVTPIVAFPVLGEDGSRAAMDRVKIVQAELDKLIGITTKDTRAAEPVVDEMVREFLEHSLGEPVRDIQDIIKGM